MPSKFRASLLMIGIIGIALTAVQLLLLHIKHPDDLGEIEPRGLAATEEGVPLTTENITGLLGNTSTGSVQKRSNLPSLPRLDDASLIEFAKVGKDYLNPVLFGSIEVANHIITTRVCEDPWRQQWQRWGRNFISPPWTTSDVANTVYEDANTRESIADDFKDVVNALAHLHVGVLGLAPLSEPWKHFRQPSTLFYPSGPNIYFRQFQGEYFSAGSRRREATNAMYETIVNIVDGVIVITSTWSPIDMTNNDQVAPPNRFDDRPRASFWSDLVWLLWTKTRRGQSQSGYDLRQFGDIYSARATEMMTPWLNWILVQGITEPEVTLQVVLRCLGSRGQRYGDIPLWANRETFQTGHWCFDALLGMENNLGPVWFLAQHKTANTHFLGIKAFQSVTIFKCEAPKTSVNYSPGPWPCLLWEVVDANEISMAQVQILENTWLDTWTHEGTLVETAALMQCLPIGVTD